MKIEIDESAAAALSMMIWHMVSEAKKALEGLVHEIDISKGYGE